MKPKVLNLSCPIIGCENPVIRTFGGIKIGMHVDEHIMKNHTIEDIIDYASKEITKYNKKRIMGNV